MWGAKETLVMESRRDDQGMVVRRVHLTRGCLSIEGHDLGPGVEEFFGYSEYEFRRSLDKAETAALRGAPRPVPPGRPARRDRGAVRQHP